MANAREMLNNIPRFQEGGEVTQEDSPDLAQALAVLESDPLRYKSMYQYLLTKGDIANLNDQNLAKEDIAALGLVHAARLSNTEPEAFIENIRPSMQNLQSKKEDVRPNVILQGSSGGFNTRMPGMNFDMPYVPATLMGRVGVDADIGQDTVRAGLVAGGAYIPNMGVMRNPVMADVGYRTPFSGGALNVGVSTGLQNPSAKNTNVMAHYSRRFAEGGEVTDEFPEEAGVMPDQNPSEAAKRLLYYKKTAAPRLPPGVIPDTGQLDGMYQEPTVASETARVFGMQPRQDRYNILPRYVPGEGIVAPEMLYDAARAVASSNVARQGYEVSPEDAVNTAFNVAGGGFGVSTAMKKPTGGGAGKDLAMFVGQKSDTWDMDKYESALDFEKAGINPAEINRLTGYWKNPSSKIWSQEISDHTASLIPGGLPTTLKDSAPITNVLSHTPLFKAYPDLKNIIIKREPGEGAKFDPEINTVFIGDKVTDPKKQLSYMIHELQHWVQAKENFPRGTSLEEIAKIETPEMAKINERLGQLFYAGKRDPKNEKEFKELMSRLKDLKRIQKDNSYALYAREEGEAQARATQARMWMDEQNRRSLTPLGDFDVPVSELIQMGEYGKLSPTSRVPGAPADIRPPVRMALPSSTTARDDLAKLLGYSEDIPNEKWLAGKVEDAVESGTNSFGVPRRMGSTTGYFGKPVEVPVDLLAKLPGERGEQSNVRKDSLDYIRKNWDKVSKEPPYIEVDPFGKAWVSEGNHRIMVAKEKGLKTLPVDIRYFSGGQRNAGELAPEKILEYNLPSTTTAREDLANIPGVLPKETKASKSPKVLPKKERDANLEKFMEGSVAPPTVYHATTQDFSKFMLSKAGKNTKHPTSKIGVFSTENPDSTDEFIRNVFNPKKYETGANVMPLHMNIKNPYEMSANNFMMQSVALQRMKKKDAEKAVNDFVQSLKDEGHDGLVIRSNKRGLAKGEEYTSDNWVALDPKQIKSAIGNQGTYDPTTPDITKAKGGEVRKPK